MGALTDLSARILAGEAEIEDHHPFSPTNELDEVAPGVAMVSSFANVAAVDTGSGLCVVDTGSVFSAQQVREALQGWTDERATTAVYTHGHIDHCMGTHVFEADGPVEVIAHEATDDRFDRYIRTAGYNGVINQRQFRAPGLRWPTEYRRADRTFRENLELDLGGEEAHLHHARGETDDHTWVWWPDRKVLCTGDLVIWCSPNAGNPQKVQRYADEWAAALRTMSAFEPEVLLPGHGLPIVGAESCRMVLDDTATLLEHLVIATLGLMNEGARLDDILHTVRAPEHLVAKPYLRPIYDEPEFVVRNIWRLYGGWYDGNPAHLHPPADGALAAEVAGLAGGAPALARRAVEVADEGDLRLAGQLAEWAAQADPDDPAVHEARAHVNARRRDDATSLMARGIYTWAETESRDRTATRG
jgi:glyoxylase-like metal-dependent hydrolase (beta-lactamase superfamily II)